MREEFRKKNDETKAIRENIVKVQIPVQIVIDGALRTDLNVPPVTTEVFMSVNSSPRKSRQEAAAAVLFWVGLFLMLIFPGWLFFHTFLEAIRQHRILSSYQPIEAKVLSSEVKQWEGSHHAIHYDAEIRYEYEVGGKTYQSEQLAALVTWGSEDWANSIVKRYQPGKQCDAFYNPANPSEAILLHGYRFSPYAETLQGAFILTSGCVVVLYLWFAKKPKLMPADNGWFAIAPGFGERQRLTLATVCMVAWYLLGMIPAAHYFMCVPPPHSTHAWHVFEFYFALGLIPVPFLIRYWRMNRNMDEARLLLDQPAGTLGRSLRFSLSQMVRRPLELKSATLRLLCLGIKRRGRSSTSTVLFETGLGKLDKRALHAGEDLALSGEVTLPPGQPPTGRERSGKFDWIAWKIEFDCRLLHAPGYSAEYRLEAKEPAVEMPEPLAKPTETVSVHAIEPEFAGRVLSKTNWAIRTLLSLAPVIIQLSGVALAVSVFLVIFPDKNGIRPFWDLPRAQAQWVFGIGAALTVIGTVWGIGFSGRLGSGYIRACMRREIKRRRDAIVQPGPGSEFVEIIPRENWNRMMSKNQSDVGFLTVDVAQREIRFEGDKERYCIPADALLSCDVEKSVFSSTAKPTAPGYFMVVLRAQTASGVWEAPIAPSASTSIFNSKARRQAAEALQKRIKKLHPASVVLGKG